MASAKRIEDMTMPDIIVDNLAVLMFLTLTVIMFVGYPVAFVLGATGVFFALLGIWAGVFKPAQFASLLPRIYAQAVDNQVLVAIPMFIFMGTMLEKSRVAEQLLQTLQVLFRRIPGGLALAVTILGTIMAATTGIVGASVIMLTLIALPVMLERGYQKELSVGTIASAGTLGILIPPSIMLVIMGDLMGVPVGTLFAGAFIPGFMLSGLYVIYIIALCWWKPHLAPPLGAAEGPQTRGELWTLVWKTFIPPAFLICLVLGSIFAGWATPTEAAGVGCLGAIILAIYNRQFSMKILRDVMHSSALTNAMVFFIVFGATLFSYVFRALGGDDVVVELLKHLGIDTGWEILTFVMLLVFIMGFFFDWIEICLVVIPIFTPILAKANFGAFIEGQQVILLWFAILLSVNMQSAFLTPPFGFALFYMKGTVPPSVTMGHIYRGIVPFVVIQMFAVAICMIFPEIVLWLPRRWGFLN
jgi:tripartite ATP-independent transporter DctM subunit